MRIEILRSRDHVNPYLDAVSAAADSDKSSLGFLPRSAYKEQAYQEKLWVAVSSTDEYVGHLLFGGVYPNLKVIQIYVAPSFRRRGVGERLLSSLVAFGEEHQYLAIKARVASDLKANAFWERLGFECVRQVTGGRSTKRLINIRVRNLDVPTLFDLTDKRFLRIRPSTLDFQELPTITSPRYALDVNVLIDIVNRRKRVLAASAILRSAFNNFVQLVATAEFQTEIARKPEQRSEPLLELVKYLPVLPPVAEEQLTTLVGQLRVIVFPKRRLDRQRAAQDLSDLTHLASCIHHRVAGFITGETALLKAGKQLADSYGLEVLSPEDFLEDEETTARFPETLRVDLPDGCDLRITAFSEGQRETIEEFLLKAGVEAELRSRIWEPGLLGARRERICCSAGDRLFGIAAWDVPPRFRPQIDLFLYVDEDTPGFVQFVDHALESVLLQQPAYQVRRVILHHGALQSATRTTALERGFRSNSFSSEPGPSLVKIAIPGVIRDSDWGRIRQQLRQVIGLNLPSAMPTLQEVRPAGLSIAPQSNRPAALVQPFDFDTIISPGICLYPGTCGVITPIRMAYAEELLAGVQTQQSLLPRREALLRLERAYFRSPTRIGRFAKGMPLFFYVSGHRGGLKAVAACARITSSATVPLEQVRMRFARQGVLPDHELERIADRHGVIHVLTFDNLLPFEELVSFTELESLGCVSRAQLITAESMSYEQILALLKRAFPSAGD